MSKQEKKKPLNWDMGKVLQQKAIHLQTYMGSPFNLTQFQLRSQWLTIMMRAVEASSELINRNISNDLFYVFFLLGNRWISHQLASYDLLINGQYGETTALHRMLFEVTDRITYFHLYPEDATRWRTWSAQDPETHTKEYRADRSYFQQSSIITKITEKGVIPASQEYQRLSSAIHPNEWGMQYYAHRSPDYRQLGLLFGPQYDFRKAFWFGLVANQVLPYPVFSFLNMCKQTHAPKSVWRWVENKYKDNLPYWEQEMKIDSEFNTFADEIEKRIASGEKMENIREEIEKRINREQTEH